ncbi:MAG TPA: site-2 protease family protein [Candidatus Paceibacterota bacterium]|nr:site-2 protease family protein [Candidatus Paceibacterota bacterium]
MTILLVVIILVFLILVHELGHFTAAKIFGVRVEEFGIGFPPRALFLGKVGDTEYTLNWIPFGGFVRLFGEEAERGQHGRGSFIDAPRWKQAVILVAGVTMNALIAYALFVAALSIGVPRVVDQLQPNELAQLYVSDVVLGSPANTAGIAAGDQVVAVHDQNGATPDALTPSALVAFISSRGGQPVTVTYIHNQRQNTVTMVPANGVDTYNAGHPAVGIGLVLVATEALPVASAVKEAFVSTQDAFIIVAQGLWEIIDTAIHGAPDLSNVVGPVGLVSAVGDAAHSGLGMLFETAAFISINLAIVNLLPIPALDGGRIFILALEALLRKSAPKLAVQVLNTVGVALIIILMVTVTYNDFARLFA